MGENRQSRQPRRHKRSDIPTAVVLAMVNTYGWRAWEILCETFPWKVVWRAYQRDLDRGYLNCGTSETRPWLEPKGKEYILHERHKAIC